MNKKLLAAAVLLAMTGTTGAAQAALITGSLLQFDTGIYACNDTNATYPNCGTQGYVTIGGSYFGVDFDGDSTVEPEERMAIASGPDGGIIIGVTQDTNGHASHSGSAHAGAGGIDAEWTYFDLTPSPRTPG